jgi:hypothetical protein
VSDAVRGDISGVSPIEYGYRMPLKNFVDYTCDWDQANELLEFVSLLSVLAENGLSESDGAGESNLIFQVNLESLLANKSLLDLRIRQIRQVCERQLAKYGECRNRIPTAPRFRAEPLARSLRFLDLRAAGLSANGIGRILYGERRSSEDRSRMLDKDRKRARSMLGKGLKDLVISVLLEPKGLLAGQDAVDRNESTDQKEDTAEAEWGPVEEVEVLLQR